MTGEFAKIAAGIKATVLFLAPEIDTFPDNFFPPLMTSFLMYDSSPFYVYGFYLSLKF